MDSKELEKVTIAGRYCETGDILIRDIELAKITHDDLIVVFGTGAYNYSMSSNYNLVPRPACILVNNGKSEVIIERETYDDLIAKQKD
jgi:diaminopimelate decarboxylase